MNEVKDKLLREAKIEERSEDILKQIFPRLKEKLSLKEMTLPEASLRGI